MLFRSFSNQEERQDFGGSAFLEFQHCKARNGTPLTKVLSISTIKHWNDDSLYVYIDQLNLFFSEYRSVLTNGIYINLKYGVVDLYGINYYSRNQTKSIIEQLSENPRTDSDVLLDWLKRDEDSNGFYILGI